VSCNLGKLYKGKVQSLRRTALWMAPRTIVLIDEVVGAPGSETVNLRFHAPRKNAIHVDGNVAEIASSLRIQTVAPSTSAWEVHRRPLTLEELAGADPLTMETRGFLQSNARLSGGRDILINILSTEAEVPPIVLVNPDPGNAMQERGVTTNAAIYARDGERHWILRGSRTTTSDGMQITSEVPVSLFLDGENRLFFSAPEATRLSIEVAGKSGSFALAQGSGRVELDF